MSSFLFGINNVLIFILLAVPGYFARKKNMLTAHQIDGLSVILVNFLWPSMVIDVMSSMEISRELMHMALFTGAAALICYSAVSILGLLYWKLRRTEKTLQGILAYAVALNNTGFIGLPFIRTALGDEAMFAASIVEVVNDLFIFTVGIFLLQYGSEKKEKLSWRDIVTPGFLSVLIGIAIFLLQIPLPDFLAKAFHYMGNATTVVAMFLVGAQLSEINLKKIFTRKYVPEVCIWRLIAVPAVLAAVLFLAFPGNHVANQALILMFCMPCASSLAVFARQYRLNTELATSYVMTSTVLLIFTLPFWVALTAGQ